MRAWLLISKAQLFFRFCRAWILVLLIYVFYTFPITFAATYGSEQFTELFPSLEISQKSLYGFIRAQLLNLFLA